MPKSVLASVLAAGLVASAGGAHAVTATATFQAMITIATTCVIRSAATLDFGVAGALSANVDQTSTIEVQCTNTTPFNIGLDKGANGASVTARLMKGPGSSIQYTLDSNPARTANWGDTVGSDTVSGTGTGVLQTFTVYARIPAQTTPQPDVYSDTITVTVTY